jgi:allophanate hydrolase
MECHFWEGKEGKWQIVSIIGMAIGQGISKGRQLSLIVPLLPRRATLRQDGRKLALRMGQGVSPISEGSNVLIGDFNSASLDMRALHSRFAADPADLFNVLDGLRMKIEDHPDSAVWISRVPWERVMAKATALEKAFKGPHGGFHRFPLFGFPFAVKDNIDVEWMDTTAACPAFAFRPESSASVVSRLEAAGAILIGKTNMDQFATGLTGSRSPYGMVQNPFNPRYISGGSSSGSAAAVASGLVSFALGTDTAGSGRIPAGFNNVVGLKPTRGVISAHGVFPACRSLDCVSVFASTCEDAFKVLEHCRGADPLDSFSRSVPADSVQDSFNRAPAGPERFLFGVPDPGHLEFFGDGESAALFREAVERMQGMGGIRVEVPFAPFAEAAKLLYQGPWLAERQVAFGGFLERNPGEVLPVIREVMAGSASQTAADGFRAYYRLRELRRQAAGLFRGMDFLLTPTAPTHYTRDEVEADPVGLNSRLGLYTNFVNLMDLCALAIPSGKKGNGLPFGVTIMAPAFKEGLLASSGARYHSATGLTMGTSAHPVPSCPPLPEPVASAAREPSFSRLAVAGLHLSGQPLNGQLTDLGARLAGTYLTVPKYRMFALERPGRLFPGLIRQTDGGGAIELEVWEIPQASLGAFMENVKEPLCIGTVELETGEKVKGFLCEPSGIGDSAEITSFGGWRAYLEGRRPPAV